MRWAGAVMNKGRDSNELGGGSNDLGRDSSELGRDINIREILISELFYLQIA